MTHLHQPWRVALLAAGVAVAMSCAAQDDNHASREREALRRTQAALRQAQEQQATLAREKDDLASQRDKLDESAKKSQSQLAAARGDASRLNASLARAGEELAAAKAHDDAERTALEQRLAEQGQRLAAVQRLADERARANASLVALLEHATQSLASAEKSNEQMHSLGLALIDRLRGRTDSLVGVDPVLGFSQVRLENEAEALRDKLDAARTSEASRAAAASKSASK